MDSAAVLLCCYELLINTVVNLHLSLEDPFFEFTSVIGVEE